MTVFEDIVHSYSLSTARQIRGARNACQVKEGQLAAAPGEIPLYLFGFLW